MFETMILGAGPAGTGPLIRAAGAGLLGDWLDGGIAVVDRAAAMGGSLGRYTLNADTFGGTLLECLDAPAAPWLRALNDDPVVRTLAAGRDALPPLPLVGRLLARLGTALTEEVARHGRSRFVREAQVIGLRLGRDGTVTAELADRLGRRHCLQAASAVLALGGRQRTNWQDAALLPGISLHRWRHKLLPSDRLLTRGGEAFAEALLARGRAPPRAVILGGSHSALSSAWMLLDRLARVRFAAAGLHILYRTEPRVFYASAAEALADGYRFAPEDVCPATGRVHRLGGLRGDGRAVWRRIRGLDGSAGEQRAVAQPIGTLDPAGLAGLLDAADLIVPAFGYRLATVPVIDPDGRRIALAETGPSVDAAARLRTATGGALANVFGVGLGSGFRPWGGMAGEPNFQGQQNSLWLYQHGLGALLHDQVRGWAAERRQRKRAARAWEEIAALYHAAAAPLPG